MFRLTLPAFFLVAMACAQSDPVSPAPANLNLADGTMGSVPSGWTMARAALDAGYSAQLRREVCPENFPTCVLFEPPPVLKNVREAVMSQTFSAVPWIGKQVRFGAWLGTLGIGGGDILLRVRVEHTDGRVDFFDDPEGSVTAQGPLWREAAGRVSADAKSISIEVHFHPEGPAWISGAVFDSGGYFTSSVSDAMRFAR